VEYGANIGNFTTTHLQITNTNKLEMPNHTDRRVYNHRRGRGRNDRDRRDYRDLTVTELKKMIHQRRDLILHHQTDYVHRRESLMTQTFAGIPNSIRGLAIGRKGAIQKLVTGRGSRDVGFVLDRYAIEDDTIVNHFKIVIRGTARDVLCAQSFIFNHISTSHKKARALSCELGMAAPFGSVKWNYDNVLKGFVFHHGLPSVHTDAVPPVRAQANPHGCVVPPPPDFGSARPGSPAYSPTYDPDAARPGSPAYSPTYDPDAARPHSPTEPPGAAQVRFSTETDWAAPVPQDNE
jgi:hypothetical protein